MSDRTGSYYVGVDLGGTKILAGVYDANLSLKGTAKFSTKPQRGPEAVLDRIARCVADAVDECDLSPGDVRAVGVGAPGTVNPETGEVVYAPNLTGWRQVPLVAELERRLGAPVAVGNDCNLCALGIHRVEYHGKPRSLAGLFVGTGVGAGLILNGQMHLGHSFAAGEAGHMVVQVDGPLCGCGRHGCLEALVSRTAILHRLQRAIQEGATTVLTEMLGPGLEDFRSGDLRRAMRRGDALVGQVVLEAAQNLGVGVANLINLLNPEVMVLGGGVIDALESEMMPAVIKSVEANVLPGTLGGVRVVASKLGDHAGIVGAAVLAQSQFP